MNKNRKNFCRVKIILYYLFRGSINTLKRTFSSWTVKYQHCLITECAYEENFTEKSEDVVVKDLFEREEENFEERDISDFEVLAAQDRDGLSESES